MLRSLLIIGLVCGLAAGVLATGVAELVGEPALDRAIAWEDARAHASGAGHEHAIVSRSVQSSVGLVAGAAIYGLALGGLFALMFAGLYGRISRAGPVPTALWLGLAAFVVLFLVPFVTYPANPPGVGDPDTISDRTALYVGMILISVLAAVAAVRLRRDLATRVRGDAATVCAAGGYLAVVVAGGLLMPPVDEVPRSFPADVLWDVRVASVGVQFALWATLAIGFAFAAERRILGAARPVTPGVAGVRARG